MHACSAWRNPRQVARTEGPAWLNACYPARVQSVTLTQVLAKPADAVQSKQQAQQYQFKFDGVFKEAAQDEIYEACASDVMRGALDGFNGSVLCYGQTGAGKTYTMSGGKSSFKERGVIPRAISHLFAEMRQKTDRRFKISVQYLVRDGPLVME
jgi:hypothetical protein